MQIIPALYLKDGQPALYIPGLEEDLTFLPQSAAEVLTQLPSEGLARIHMLDVSSWQGHQTLDIPQLVELARVCPIPCEVAGGVVHLDQIKALEYGGIHTVGVDGNTQMDLLQTLAEVDHVDLDNILVSFDILRDKELLPALASVVDWGYSRVLLRDVQAEDFDKGPDFNTIESTRTAFPDLHVALGGNIRTFQDVEALRQLKVNEVMVGNEIYLQPELLHQLVAYNERVQRA